jgi:hypothetical protein
MHCGCLYMDLVLWLSIVVKICLLYAWQRIVLFLSCLIKMTLTFDKIFTISNKLLTFRRYVFQMFSVHEMIFLCPMQRMGC